MSLMRPYSRDLMALREQMNRLLEESTTGDGAAQGWAPAVDVSETPKEIVLQAELPGMKKDEIDIQLTGDTLILRGERKLESARRGEHFHRIERQYGNWQRTFQIETPIDASRVAATYELGVLTIRLPKQDTIQPRQIAIEVG